MPLPIFFETFPSSGLQTAREMAESRITRTVPNNALEDESYGYI